jgi:hypothetical protein
MASHFVGILCLALTAVGLTATIREHHETILNILIGIGFWGWLALFVIYLYLFEGRQTRK